MITAQQQSLPLSSDAKGLNSYANGGNNDRPGNGAGGPIPCLEVPFQTRVPDEPLQKEATAQAMASSAWGCLHSSAGFLGPALLHLATKSAKDRYCREHTTNEDCRPEDSSLRVYGIRVSSLLAVGSVVAILTAALMMPLVGAIIDRSSHRRTAGAAVATAIVAINFSQIFVSEKTWALFWLSHCVSDALFIFMHMFTLAYLQELTGRPGNLSLYASRFATIQFLSTGVFMFSVIAYAHGHRDIVHTSRFAHIVSGTAGAVGMGYAWAFLFGPRSPRRELTEGESILYSSLAGLRETLSRVRMHYPALKWLLVTMLWSPDVGSGCYMSMFSTLHKSLLGMSGAQIGLANCIGLVSALAGAQVSCLVCTKLNPLVSFQLSVLSFAAINALIAAFVAGPAQIPLYFFMMSLVGASLGWLVTTQKVLFCTLAPTGQEAEIMGLILCLDGALAWLPPLLFGFINEMGLSLRWALASQDVILALALLCTVFIGPYDEAVRQARDPSRKPHVP